MDCPAELKTLLKVIYNLSSAEAEVLSYLCDTTDRASEIAAELGKDRSTVQRYLSTLQTAGLITRESRVEDGKRGRYYVYSVPDKDRLKQQIRERLADWEAEKLAVLDDF